MRTKRLGNNGPEISVIGYGAWEIGGMWGTNPPDEEMIAAMHAGFEAGITWVDTAEVYGNGISESVVARAIADHPDVLVFTKVAPKPAGTGFGPEDVRAAAHASAKRLGRDVIDLYQLHWPDENVPVEETWGAMAALTAEGIVRHIGVSNFSTALIERCEKISHVDSLQPQFSMLARDPAADLLPLCERNGTGVIAYGPMAFGLLTGAIGADTRFEDTDWRAGKMGMSNYDKLFKPGVRERHLKTLDRLRPIAERLGASLAELALAWVAAQPGITGAIAGSRRPNHVRENARGGDLTLGEKDLSEIGEILGR